MSFRDEIPREDIADNRESVWYPQRAQVPLSVVERFSDSIEKDVKVPISAARTETSDLVSLGCELTNYGGTFLADCELKGVRCTYHIRYNPSVKYCVENRFLYNLQKMLYGTKNTKMTWRKILHEAMSHVINLFWPFLTAELAQRNDMRLNDKENEGPDLSRPINLQLKTFSDGEVARCVEHGRRAAHKVRRPFKNPVPHMLRFDKADVEKWIPIRTGMFIILVHGALHFLKTVKSSYRLTLKRELKLLAKLPEHANVRKLMGVLDDGEGDVEGIVLEYIEGDLLSRIDSAEIHECVKWKKQLNEAVSFLHEHGIVWGDAKPENIIISDINRDIELIDFGGGYTEGWVSEELAETIAGDLEGVKNISRIIDGLHDKGIVIAS